MIFYLLFQIIFSWLITCCILKAFNKALSTSNSEFYQEPVLLTALFSVFNINLAKKSKLIAGKIVHHKVGICFSATYYLIWYFEFVEISWTTTIIIGVINALVCIICWTFLLEIIPSISIANFKGYYLQLVFLHNIFLITVFLVNWIVIKSLPANLFE